jgi:hypothetical protein
MGKNSDTSKIEVTAARWPIAASTAAILFLASVHIRSPEFDPAFRMGSEYANGHYGWVVSLMLASWGLSCCDSFVHPSVKTACGKRHDRRQTGSKG